MASLAPSLARPCPCRREATGAAEEHRVVTGLAAVADASKVRLGAGLRGHELL
jgi:hypothetical protein